MPEAVELALHKTGDSLGELSAPAAARTLGWKLLDLLSVGLTALEKVTKERSTLRREVAERKCEL